MYSLKSNPNHLFIKKEENNPQLSSMNIKTALERSIKNRPITSLGFSINDVNEKIVNLHGVKVNKAYEKETMYTLYGDFTGKPRTELRATSTYKRDINNLKITDKVFPLDGVYFKEFDNQYKALLTETQQQYNGVKNIKNEIKSKCNKSNVLTSDKINDSHSKTQSNFFSQNNKYFQSDIFNLNDKLSSQKTAEKYTTNEFKKNYKPYTVSSKSNSEWKAFTAHPTLLGHTNIKFHILNPGVKSDTKTREELLGYSGFNPIHRQKMLSEYIDITRVGCPNPSSEFRTNYSNNPKIFNRISDNCTKFLDNHHKNYKIICNPPFKK